MLADNVTLGARDARNRRRCGHNNGNKILGEMLKDPKHSVHLLFHSRAWTCVDSRARGRFLLAASWLADRAAVSAALQLFELAHYGRSESCAQAHETQGEQSDARRRLEVGVDEAFETVAGAIDQPIDVFRDGAPLSQAPSLVLADNGCLVSRQVAGEGGDICGGGDDDTNDLIDSDAQNVEDIVGAQRRPQRR